MSGWYYEQQLAKQFLLFKVSKEEAAKFLSARSKDTKILAEQVHHMENGIYT